MSLQGDVRAVFPVLGENAGAGEPERCWLLVCVQGGTEALPITDKATW